MEGIIRPIRRGDERAVAELHRESINTGFLSSLGFPFLKVLYRAMEDSDNAFVLVYEEGGELKGFVSGVKNLRVFYSEFVRRNLVPAVISMFPSLVRIDFVRKAFETLIYPQKTDNLPEAELLSIAVREELRGKGIALLLFRKFVEEMEKRGVKRFKVVVGSSNFRANGFYKKVGFRLLGKIQVHEGEESNVWVYEGVGK